MPSNREKVLCLAVLVAGVPGCDSSTAAMPYSSAGSAGAASEAIVTGGKGSQPSAPPAQIAKHKAYIGLFGDDAVGVLDVDNKVMIKTVPVTAPDGLIITPDGKKVFVSSADSASVKVINTDSDTVTGSIDVGDKPAGLAITPDGSLVVASVGGVDEAVIIDADSESVVRHVSVGQAHSSCITSDGHFAYVGSQVSTAPAVVKVDLQGDAQPQSFAVDKSPRALACEADHVYFTAVGLDAVERLDPATGKLDTPIASDGSPHDVRAAEPGKTELVVSQTAGDLQFIDIASASVTDSVPTGKLAHWITLNADRTLAYVTNEGDNNVAVVDLAAKTVTEKIDVGKAPRKMALQQ